MVQCRMLSLWVEVLVSPLPFIICTLLRPLPEAIRVHQGLSGVKLGDTEHIISLYADDILLFITSQEHPIPILLSLINQSGLISAYKMNYNKSEALPSGDSGDWVSLANFPFRWSTAGFTYLGIRVTAHIKELYKLNFKATLKSVKNDLHMWFGLCLWPAELVWSRRMYFPGYYTLTLQILTLKINTKVILYIEGLLSKFIWRGKKSRLKTKTLDRGGVWCCAPLSLFSLISTDIGELKNNPIMISTLRIWRVISEHIGRRDFSFGLQPLIKNKAFPPGVGMSIFDDWYSEELRWCIWFI